jgi:hypothetical protein
MLGLINKFNQYHQLLKTFRVHVPKENPKILSNRCLNIKNLDKDPQLWNTFYMMKNKKRFNVNQINELDLVEREDGKYNK